MPKISTMLQRIQTVYLALGSIIMGLQGTLSMAIFFGSNKSYKMTVFGVQPKTEVAFTIPAWTLGALGVLLVVAMIYALLQFKNRPLQMRVIRIVNLMLFAHIILGFYMVNDYSGVLRNNGFEHSLEYGFGLIVPLLAVVFTMLASKAIKKDDELIRSADRLR